MPSVLIDADDLTAWANRRDAQGELPRLIRKLILGSTRQLEQVRFPAGGGVHLGGWDGIAAAEHGNPFVPKGLSVWEMSAEHRVKEKAEADYQKRCADPKGVDPSAATFVFVTPRRWGGKHEWEAAKRSEGFWREVRAVDADDLETWLEAASAVHVWFSVALGRLPEGVVDLATWWNGWSESTRPHLSPEFVLAGRADVVAALHGWLRGSAETLALRAESRDEATAVLAAAVRLLPPDDCEAVLSRVLVVRSATAWARLTGASPAGLILIGSVEGSDAIARAVRSGHRVVVPLGRQDSPSAATVQVPRLSIEEAAQALARLGLGEAEASEAAGLAVKSISSFRRRLAIVPETQQPWWGRPDVARRFLPALLAGSWDGRRDGDQRAVSKLAQAEYRELTSDFVRSSSEEDPLIRRTGESWALVNKDDAWSFLARFLTLDDVQRFEQVALEVLGAPDPRFDLEDEKQWMADALGRGLDCSDLLRESLSDTLAFLGAHGGRFAPVAGRTLDEYAARIVTSLLRRAKGDWRVWASLAQFLPRLAEAAPDVLLDAVEQDMRGGAPVIGLLFRDQRDALFSTSPHTGLLWALETLAWNPEHLGRAVLLLARLARNDPGGKLTNRPANSLLELFMPWHPQTSATVEQRLAAIDRLREREPDVAWNLMRRLLKSPSTASTTPTPRWRDWSAEAQTGVTRREHFSFLHELAMRAAEDVGTAGSRWRQLIEVVPALPPRDAEAVLARLDGIRATELADSARALIWNALREVISHHRSLPDAPWALPPERVERFAALLARFEPEDWGAKYGWLFDHHPALPDGGSADWHTLRDQISERRRAAVEKIYAAAGIDTLLGLASQVVLPVELGLVLGAVELAGDDEERVLNECCDVPDSPSSRLALGFVIGRLGRHGREWGERLLPRSSDPWSPKHAALLGCLPPDARTWELADQLGGEARQRYWARFSPYAVRRPEDVEFVVRRLLENSRPGAASALLAMQVDVGALPPLLTAEVLEAAVQEPPEADLDVAAFARDASRLVDVLERAGSIEQSRLALLEWALLPLLEYSQQEPKALLRELGRDPQLFADVVAVVYRAAQEERSEPTEGEEERARRGYKLLSAWRTPPGLLGDGTIDEAVLRDWVDRARAATEATGRGVMGDQMIGQVLSGAPPTADGMWPPPAVCSVLEAKESVELERGFEVATHNARGVFTKGPFEGGDQERRLSERFDGFARAARDRWPRTASVLRRIAAEYAAQARLEDQAAELRRDRD